MKLEEGRLIGILEGPSLTFSVDFGMSCRGRCGPGGNTPPPRGINTSGSGPPPSHRTVHISMERSPTRPEPMGGSYAEYSGYGNIRIPPAARASTPGPYGYPSQYDTFGSQIDYNLSWMPKDINLSELLDQTSSQVSSRFRRMEQNISHTPSAIPPLSPDITPTNANPLLGKEQASDETSPTSKKNEKEREESLIEWFDRSVEKELRKHKAAAKLGGGSQFMSPIQAPPDEDDLPELNLSRGVLERMAGANASQVEMCSDLRKEPVTELTDAVDKLAKAEAMCAFAGAVKAAEAAADAAPPELVEEAALASARGFQTDVRATTVHGELEGVRPIEVVGYVGVTKPKYPTKRK